MNKKKLMEEAVKRIAGSKVLNMIREQGLAALQPGGDFVQGFILYSDIAELSLLSEQQTPQELFRIQNEGLEQVLNVIDDNDGEIIDIVGDSVLAYWEGMSEESAGKACRAAVEITTEPNQMRAGVSGGPFMQVVQGSSIRLKYSILGDTVNLAYRLCDLNRQYGTRLLINDALVEPASSKISCRLIEKVRVKGQHTPLLIYDLIVPVSQITEKQKNLCALFSEARDRFLQGEWAVAADLFESILVNHDDPVSNVYLNRSRRYLKNPPPSAWDGVSRQETR